MKNNQMVSFEYIMNNFDKKMYIPLIQRNYKWSADMASKLALDLFEAFESKQEYYTVGMITLYKENNKFQLIDGQQRIITLYMILKFIESGKEFFSFEFERDDGINKVGEKRVDYLRNINECEKWTNIITDVKRFKTNYCAIKKAMLEKGYDDSKKNEFLRYIVEKIFFLLHISETEPYDEFMNLNNNKTRFVISDRIKANLMIDAKENNKKEVIELFRNLSEILFANSEVWDLVCKGYCEESIPQDKSKRRRDKHYPDENRLKLLCCERYGSNEYDVSGTLGYEYCKEIETLTRYNDMLHVLKKDIEDENWNSFNGFNCLRAVSSEKVEERTRFFQLLKGVEHCFLEEYYIDEIKKCPVFNKACFVQSQLESHKIQDIDGFIKIKETIKSSFNNDDSGENKKKTSESAWFSNGDKYFEAFIDEYKLYIKQKYSI